MTYQPKILIIDDEPLVVNLFSDILEEAGYEVGSALTSVEGLLMLSRARYDGLICDVYLETLDGFGVAEFARRTQPDLGILLMTGRPNSECLLRADAAGIEVLPKPVPIPVLMHQVERLCIRSLAAARNITVSSIAHSLLSETMRFEPR